MSRIRLSAEGTFQVSRKKTSGSKAFQCFILQSVTMSSDESMVHHRAAA